MSFFNDYMREGRGVSKGIDTRPRIIVFFDIFFRKFWKLVVINLMYIIFCIPLITIGPATAGITKILRNYAREEHAFVWADFWETFKQNFGQALAVFVLDIIAFILIFFDGYIYMMIAGNPWLRIISLAVIMITATIILFMNYYIFPMMVTFKLTFKQLIKNAFIFAWVGFWRNLLITLILASYTIFAVIYFMSFGPIFVLLLYFSLSSLIINFGVYPLIKRHMIDGYDPNTGEKIED